MLSADDRSTHGSAVEACTPAKAGRRRWAVVCLLAAVLALSSCTGGGELARCGGSRGSLGASGTNLFANPSFEEGPEPWLSYTPSTWGTHLSISEAVAHSGVSSARLELRSADAEADPIRVYGAVQEITPEEFPEVVSGFYCVERWEQGTPKQYLQFVVIVWEAANIPPEVASVTNHQVRYILAGVERQPIQISNARFVMVGKGEPGQGRWVPFERNIRDDFRELWGTVPAGFTKLALFFEVRWDDRQPQDGPSLADVYYDDLYVGPAAGDTNQSTGGLASPGR